MKNQEGLNKVLINKEWGYIDNLGNTVIPPKLENADNFSNGFAKVSYYREYLRAYIDKKGNKVFGWEEVIYKSK